MYIIILICLTATIGCNNISGTSNAAEDSTVVFAGTTPCSNIIRPIHDIQSEPDCPLIECKCVLVEWELTLFIDAGTKQPTYFKLKSINRSVVNETNLYSEPGKRNEVEGKWTINKGTNANFDATVYQLNPVKPAKSLNLLKLDDNLLHILDEKENLMIGNEFHSYTLSRIFK